MKLRYVPRYVLSWLTSEGLGLTVCRMLGHRPQDRETYAFQLEMADLFGHPPDSELRTPICTRCGGDVDAADVLTQKGASSWK